MAETRCCSRRRAIKKKRRRRVEEGALVEPFAVTNSGRTRKRYGRRMVSKESGKEGQGKNPNVKVKRER